MKWDVAIVGGGPAGCFLGRNLAKEGLDVVIIEEHEEIGSNVCCAGIVGASGLQEIGIKPGKWVLGELKRAVFYPPSGEPAKFGRKKTEAFVVDRSLFDMWLGEEAAKAGAAVLLNTRCTGVKLGKDWQGLLLEGADGGWLKARLVVGADGPASVVARAAGLRSLKGVTRCAQVECKADVDASTAEVYLSKKFAPGFFGWAVRAGEKTRIGLGTTEGNPVKLLQSFMKHHPVMSAKISNVKTTGYCAAPIPPPFSTKICADGVILVGDAAGQVKPLTGGGIYLGLSCARIASDVVAKTLDHPSGKNLAEYESRVKKKFGMEVQMGLRGRRAFQRMSDDDLKAVVELLRDEDVKKLVDDNFSFDDHGKLLGALVKNAPAILRKVGARRLVKFARLFLT
ncbi:MAG: NAD(P)/FAD-dependent oxidoreductase [Candidatus Hadarchaeota archaeon]